MCHFAVAFLERALPQLSRKGLRAFLELQYRFARAGLEAETSGPEKLAKVEAVQKSLSERLGTSRIGTSHREELAVISLDVRGSSQLAATNTREDIFVAFHCLLPMAAFLIRQDGGEVIGLRGDGILGVVGFDEKYISTMVLSAYEIGMTLIEATTDVLNPFLDDKDVPIKFAVGVGVDHGPVTMTKIGFGDDFEVTAYGEAVNAAAKNSRGTNALWMSGGSKKFMKTFPANEQYLAPGKQRILDVLAK